MKSAQKLYFITIIGLLITLLLGSNVWWYRQYIELAKKENLQFSLREDCNAVLAQSLTAVLANGKANATEGSVREGIKGEGEINSLTIHDENGFYWNRFIGLRFDQNGKLVEIQPASTKTIRSG